MRDRSLRAFVFDMDGTLLDSLPVVLECYRRAVADLGGPDLRDDEILASFAVGPAARMLETLIGRPVGREAVARYEGYLAERTDGVAAYEGIAEVLAALGDLGPLGVFTAADTSAAELLLSATGLRDWVGPVVGADRVARAKPAPDGLLAVCASLGVEPETTAYVGDGPADVEVARACGAVAVAAAWGHQYEEGRDADVVARFPRDLLALAGAPFEAGGVS